MKIKPIKLPDEGMWNNILQFFDFSVNVHKLKSKHQNINPIPGGASEAPLRYNVYKSFWKLFFGTQMAMTF